MTCRSARAWWYLVFACLLLARLPSLVQPAGADQALYAYVGTRILDGGLPYRDAWDQKPPAIHFLYALMFGLWRHDSVVAAADLAAAALVAWLLIRLGRALTGTQLAGGAAASLFLLLGDPTLTRLAGVRVRSQCETFIAVAITAALVLAVECGRRASQYDGLGAAPRRRAGVLGLAIGVLVGLAAVLKYNAAAYAPVVALALWVGCERAAARRALLTAVPGFLLPVASMMVIFAAGGALDDLYQATIRFNLEYSAETYTGPLSTLRYLLTFPMAQARIDSLWTVGGLGCLVLLAGAVVTRSWSGLLPVLWVAAAAVSIAINGSRGLPQYFVQAAPALALAAGVAAARLWPATLISLSWRPAARAAGILLVSYAAWRVTDFDKIPRNAAHDLAYMAGRLSREEHLARYGGREDDKYIALSVWRLGRYLEARTTPADPVYVFGFSAGAYVQANRVSASRFFWSRPVLIGFNAEAPGYGARGLIEDLESSRPRYVALQRRDWAPPPGDSASYFRAHPLLNEWLRTGYRRVDDYDDETFEIWVDGTRR